MLLPPHEKVLVGDAAQCLILRRHNVLLVRLLTIAAVMAVTCWNDAKSFVGTPYTCFSAKPRVTPPTKPSGVKGTRSATRREILYGMWTSSTRHGRERVLEATTTGAAAAAAAAAAPPSHTSTAVSASESAVVETPLARFNSQVNYHRPGANLPTTIVDPAMQDFDDSNVVILSFVELMEMAFVSATTPEMYQKRQQMVHNLQQHGGFCLIELNDDIDSTIMNGMWDAVEELFDQTGSTDDDSSASSSSSTPTFELRRQVLTRDRVDQQSQQVSTQPDSASPDTGSGGARGGGYDFVQTTVVQNEIRPLSISQKIGEHGAYQLRNAYLFLSQLCKAYATVLYAGATESSPQQATTIMESLLDEPKRSFSGSYHRLCRYVRLSSDSDKPASNAPEIANMEEDCTGSKSNTWNESLRSHVDWTVSTAIPVSAIAGLEIYHPTQHQWIRIEQVARRNWEQKQSQQELPNNVPSSSSRWNSQYVVLMVGAWLELLTEGKLESTLHRVVSDCHAQQHRLSAPFFMRPQELVFEKTNQVFDNADDERIMNLTPQQTKQEISRFLRDGVFLSV